MRVKGKKWDLSLLPMVSKGQAALILVLATLRGTCAACASLDTTTHSYQTTEHHQQRENVPLLNQNLPLLVKAPTPPPPFSF